MGTLFLPSLEEKRCITVTDISEAEAVRMCELFTTMTKESRKIKDATINDSDIVMYHNIIDFSREPLGIEYDPSALCHPDLDDDINNPNPDYGLASDFLNKFYISDNKNFRGARAVYIDFFKNVFGVGTTIVYNQNWATINYGNDEEVKRILESMYDLDRSHSDVPATNDDDPWY